MSKSDEMNDMEKGTEETAKDDHGHEKQPPPPPPDEDDTLSSYKLSLFATVTLIIVIGAMVAAAFMGLGITAEHQDVQSQFDASATDLVQKIQTAWESYVTAASMMHNFCRHRNFTRAEFRGLYEYMIDTGLNFQAAQFDPNITDDERDDAEAEARAYYAQYYPHIHYQGFTGFNWENSTQVEPRNRAPFYFPIHYMEPIIGNEPAIDLDYYASGSRQRTVTFCMEHGKPALTDRLRLVQETAKASYGVVLFHPGVNVTSSNETWPRDLASIVIRIPDLLLRSAENQHQASIIYLYDKSDSHGIPLFLGAAQVEPPLGPRRKSSATLTPLPEIPLQEAMTGTYRTYNINAANKIWIVIVQRADGTFDPHPVFVILGGVIIFVATVCLAIWVYSNTIRMKNFQEERAKAKAEKAAFILESAQLAAHRERELNDFIAHEVRNPVAAAMAACSFVKAAIHKDPPFPTYESLETAREDIGTIDNALLFVNDLLRDMLDMHRATNHQLIIKLTPTDILHDVLEPVDGMLYQREGHMRVSVECPKNLVVMSDRLRLKQVILNLGRNSAKFVDGGFLKLRARVDDNGMVQLLVEDSGPGIPVHKRSQLFNKYQESLDMLNQGTGIGLFLCKNLIELMGGTIRLDETYDSGVPGCPGTRFIVDLKRPPTEFDSEMESYVHDNAEYSNGVLHIGESALVECEALPGKLSALFVDDDPILRKLFARTVKTVAPDWQIREASSGEAALRLVAIEKFDVIFCDMYMASVEKSLLGTETVELMRKKGVKCRICGLSANDKEKEFLEAGADCFTLKPFPCERNALTRELCRILNQQTPADV